MTTERFAAAALAGLGAAALVVAGASQVEIRGGEVSRAMERWRDLALMLLREGHPAEGFDDRRALALVCFATAVAGFSLLGAAGAVGGLVLAPFALRFGSRARRASHAARIDRCAAGFALAIASALSAGRSLRGALLAAGTNTPAPLRAHVERLQVDLALGDGTAAALERLSQSCASPRIDALCGAIALHRDSGGDLVGLLRELAAAFQVRDRAVREAYSASAQARYTAMIVAAIPLVLAPVVELASPGAVSGAVAFAPSAVMLAIAATLMAAGGWICMRIGRAA